MRRVVFDRLRPALFGHLIFLTELHKASAISPPSDRAEGVKEIFGESFYESVKALDFNKPGPTIPATTWLNYAAMRASEFRAALERVLDTYMSYLDPANIEVIENLQSSFFLRVLMMGPDIPVADRAINFNRPSNPLLIGLNERLRQHVANVLALLDQLNDVASKRLTIGDFGDLWRTDVAPQTGSARMNLPEL